MRISSAAIEVGLENASHSRVDDEFRSVAGIFGGRRQFSQGLGQFGEALVDDGHQQSVPVPEVVLHHTPGHAGTFGDVPALAAAKPSSRMQRTVSSITSARVRSARGWLPLAGRRGATTGAMASRSPHHTADMAAGRSCAARRPLGARAHRFDHVDGAGRGGDHAALVVVDAARLRRGR